MHLAPFSQIRENAGTVVALLAPSNDDELREEVKTARGRAHQIGCYLDKLHIFMLAHVMRRPIVVYHYDSGQPRGSTISGIYLPDLWEELGEQGDGCSRVPLSLVYTGGTATNGLGHFTACVGTEGRALVLPLSDHVHGRRLLIRYGPDHVDMGPSGAASGAATTVAPAGEATPVDRPTAGLADSWAAHLLCVRVGVGQGPGVKVGREVAGTVAEAAAYTCDGARGAGSCKCCLAADTQANRHRSSLLAPVGGHCELAVQAGMQDPRQHTRSTCGCPPTHLTVATASLPCRPRRSQRDIRPFTPITRAPSSRPSRLMSTGPLLPPGSPPPGAGAARAPSIQPRLAPPVVLAPAASSSAAARAAGPRLLPPPLPPLLAVAFARSSSRWRCCGCHPMAAYRSANSWPGACCWRSNAIAAAAVSEEGSACPLPSLRLLLLLLLLLLLPPLRPLLLCRGRGGA